MVLKVIATTLNWTTRSWVGFSLGHICCFIDLDSVDTALCRTTQNYASENHKSSLQNIHQWDTTIKLESSRHCKDILQPAPKYRFLLIPLPPYCVSNDNGFCFSELGTHSYLTSCLLIALCLHLRPSVSPDGGWRSVLCAWPGCMSQLTALKSTCNSGRTSSNWHRKRLHGSKYNMKWTIQVPPEINS